MIYELYLEEKLKYEDCLIFIKVGHFYQTFDEDGIILNYLFGYKMIGKRVGFPVLSFSRVVEKLKDFKINYFCEEQGQSFVDNRYQNPLEKGKKIFKLKERVEKNF